MRCIIVVPTYNESETVSALLDPLTHLVPGSDLGASRVDVLVVDDSSPDGTGAVVSAHPTSEIPAMIADLVDHDVVIGSRYVAGGRTVHWPRRRRALSWGANTYARLLLGLRTRDSTSGFRAFTERSAGSSKMSIGVAGEAAVRVRRWRFDELRGHPAAARAEDAASRLAPGGRR